MVFFVGVMAEKKKPKSVDDIVSEYQKFHHAGGKSFEKRMKKFEEFHDPDNIHMQQFAMHAHYTVFGKPSDSKNFPGAYNEAFKVLDKHITDDNDKLDDEDKLTEIIETYVDTFLEKAIGKPYKDMIKSAKDEGASEKDLRNFKQTLLDNYLRDSEGNRIPLLNERYIKSLKKRKKIELIGELQGISEKMKETYTIHLLNKATGELFSEDDRSDMAEYITPKFKKQGWKHGDPHVFRSVQEQEKHYSALLSGAGEKLKKAGYKIIKDKEKET